jgi:hypothetical protein
VLTTDGTLPTARQQALLALHEHGGRLTLEMLLARLCAVVHLNAAHPLLRTTACCPHPAHPYSADIRLSLITTEPATSSRLRSSSLQHQGVCCECSAHLFVHLLLIYCPPAFTTLPAHAGASYVLTQVKLVAPGVLCSPPSNPIIPHTVLLCRTRTATHSSFLCAVPPRRA